MELPEFRYHPDPLATGAIVESHETCECCGKSRGYLYTGSIYSAQNVENLCPWCIASGEAAAKFSAIFSAIALTAEGGSIPEPVSEEIQQRTPGFASYQQEEWLFHCGDGCEFRGLARVSDLKKISEEETQRLYAETYLDETELGELKQAEDSVELIDFFKFLCRHCGEIKLLMDSD